MPANKHGKRLVALVLALSMVAGACSGGDDAQDLEAFCALLESGPVLSGEAADVGNSDFESLLLVAPSEISESVQQLQATSRSLDEIPDLELAELFNAAFDPEARAARNDLVSFAGSQCQLAVTSGGLSAPVLDPQDEIDTYLNENYETAAWIDAVSVSLTLADTQISSVEARLRRAPVSNQEGLEICRALSVYLYEIRGDDASVAITRNGDVVASRAGRDGVCLRP